MNSYIIAYDVDSTINSPIASSQAYSAIKGAIESYDIKGQLTESCWCICSNETARTIRDKLCRVSRECDRILVVQSANVAAWSNLYSTNAWLKDCL